MDFSHSTPQLPQSQYGSTYGSHEQSQGYRPAGSTQPQHSDPPSSGGRQSKRARLDPRLYNNDMSSDGPQPQASPFSRDGPYPARGHPAAGHVSSQLSRNFEQEVRGLSQYESNASSQPQMGNLPPGLEYSPSGEVLPQRGAPPGAILKMACQYCDRKKRKCPRDWPCSECKKDGQECVPKARKYQRPKMPATPGGEQQAENGEDASPPVEDGAVTAINRESESTPARGREESNRKQNLRMGPVIGDHQEWSNMRLEYHPLPPNIDEVREKLYKLEQPILLNSQQYADYWPHITNVYGRQIQPVEQANGSMLEYWECRNNRKRRLKGRPPPKEPQKRKRTIKTHLLETDKACGMRFRVLYFVKHANTDENHSSGLDSCRCVPEWVHLQRTGRVESLNIQHNHSLESMDRFKRSDAIVFYAALKVQEGGYMYAAVRRWIMEKFGSATKQIEHLSISDIANASRFWRQQNPELELIPDIPDDDPAIGARKRALESINRIAPESLRRALAEVFKQLPAAIEIAQPFLESVQTGNAATSNGAPIMEGDKIEVPLPGMPVKYMPLIAPRWNVLIPPEPSPPPSRRTAAPDAKRDQPASPFAPGRPPNGLALSAGKGTATASHRHHAMAPPMNELPPRPYKPASNSHALSIDPPGAHANSSISGQRPESAQDYSTARLVNDIFGARLHHRSIPTAGSGTASWRPEWATAADSVSRPSTSTESRPAWAVSGEKASPTAPSEQVTNEQQKHQKDAGRSDVAGESGARMQLTRAGPAGLYTEWVA
ncbi:uncharacterized protein LTR77_005296 [Saxophila tyrrhenica]|uniref:Zn(2)-C6 fungal-type domain-containing protein n=1 Tax=Saxophila tyrrhenica TaxID=1690608 RepID=A0AAV9P831_9PEZI|nr:hypothetical protein LTR77_005296 [Saxophila tyrrhenica]